MPWTTLFLTLVYTVKINLYGGRYTSFLFNRSYRYFRN